MSLNKLEKAYRSRQQQTQRIGYTYTEFQGGDKKSREMIYICRNLTRALLGKPVINWLEIAKFIKPTTYSCNEVVKKHDEENVSNNKLVKLYPEVFNGLDDI